MPLYWILLLVATRAGISLKDLPSLSSKDIPICSLMNQTAESCFLPNPRTGFNTTAGLKLGYVTNGDRRAIQVITLISKRTDNPGLEVSYRGFNSSEEMVAFNKEVGDAQKFGLGLVFENGSNGLAYSIRMPYESSPNVNSKVDNGQSKYTYSVGYCTLVHSKARKFSSNALGMYLHIIGVCQLQLA